MQEKQWETLSTWGGGCGGKSPIAYPLPHILQHHCFHLCRCWHLRYLLWLSDEKNDLLNPCTVLGKMSPFACVLYSCLDLSSPDCISSRKQAGERHMEGMRGKEALKPLQDAAVFLLCVCFFFFVPHPHPFANYSELHRKVCGSRGSMFNWPVGLTECCCIDEAERCVARTPGKLRFGMTMTTLGTRLSWRASHSQDNHQLACFTESLECRRRLQ